MSKPHTPQSWLGCTSRSTTWTTRCSACKWPRKKGKLKDDKLKLNVLNSGLDVNLLEREAAEGSDMTSSAAAVSPRPALGSAGKLNTVNEAAYVEAQRAMALRRSESMSPSVGAVNSSNVMPLDQLLSTPSVDETLGESRQGRWSRVKRREIVFIPSGSICLRSLPVPAQ